jgi:citrate synthase
MAAAAMTSAEACDRLGIRPQTLYAYVSRGLLTRHKVGRLSRFPVAEVEALAQRTARGRRPGRFEITIETAITLLDPGGRLFYRGVDATQLVGRWSFERVSQWLWSGSDSGEPPPWTPGAAAVAIVSRIQRDLRGDTPAVDRVRVTVAALASEGELDPPTLIATVVDALPTLLTEGRRDRSAPGSSIAGRLWRRLTCLPATPDRVRTLDGALVLLADHELAASTLAARIAASTGAAAPHVVLAGLATLAGPLHGGAHTPALALVRDAARRGPEAALDAAVQRLGRLPGVGHPLYHTVDPRAEALLAELARVAPRQATKQIDGLVQAMRARTTAPVNVDFALAALVHTWRMTLGAGETIHAVARMAGWLAHAAEESSYQLRFRPRAVYTGVRP